MSMDGETPASGPAIDVRAATLEIAQLPLHQPAEAELRLAALLDRIIAAPPAAADLFGLLEYARTSLHFVRAAAVRQFHEHAPHLESETEAHFLSGLGMWQRMVQAYCICADADAAGNAPASSEDDGGSLHVATVVHRCLYYLAMQIVDHYRVKRQIPEALWQRTNTLYQYAEEHGVTGIGVQHELGGQERKTNCRGIYAALLLTEFAQPYSRSGNDFETIWDLAEQTGHLVRIGRSKLAANKTAFLVDLGSDQPLRPMPGGELPATVRALETSVLVGHLRERLAYFEKARQRGSENIETAERQIRLLTALIPSWTLTAMPRRYRRAAADGMVTLSTGFPHMHFFVLGREFVPPGEAAPPLAMEHASESWLVIDQNPCGFRLARTIGKSRLENRQLLAICPHDGDEFLLAQVHWLMQERSGRLTAGVSALPGVPQAVAVRLEERVKSQKAQVRQAFWLPGMAGLQIRETLVLPPGLFRPGLAVDLLADGVARTILLDELIQRGSDFEQVSFRAA